MLTPHPIYLVLDTSAGTRCGKPPALFRPHLEREAIADIRLALNQSQPLGDHRFHAKIARIAGEPRQARPRGRPRLAGEESGVNGEQGHLEL